MFVSAETISEIASDMQSRFEFDLHSQSSISEKNWLIAECQPASHCQSLSPEWL